MAEQASDSGRSARSANLGTLVAACLGSYANLATTLAYSFGVFMLPIAEATGWDRDRVAEAIGPALLVNVISQPLVGILVDRVGARRVGVVAPFGLALGLVLVATIPQTAGQFQMLLAVAVLLGSCASPTVYSSLVTSTFERRRGLMLGIALAFTGVGIASLPPLSVYMIGTNGWRHAYLAIAAIVALLGCIGALLILRDRPAPTVAAAAPDAGPKPGLTVRQVVRGRPFWVMFVAFALLGAVANGIPLHIPVILSERGFSATEAAMGMTVMGVAVVVSRPLLGFLYDKYDQRYVTVTMLAGPLAGSLLFYFTAQPWLAIVAAAGFGIAVGGEFVGMACLLLRAFGLRAFGLLYGLLTLAVGVGIGTGPILIARMHAATGDYQLVLAVAAIGGLATIGAILSLRTRDFPFAAKAG